MEPISQTLSGFQLSLLPTVEEFWLEHPQFGPEKRVLGGDGYPPTGDPPALKSHRACGWLEEKTTKRQRKNRDAWICHQWWLHWEEPGGKKRSCYVPKHNLAEVKHSVYVLKRPIDETLKLLEKE
jgi:hypothetical protein